MVTYININLVTALLSQQRNAPHVALYKILHNDDCSVGSWGYVCDNVDTGDCATILAWVLRRHLSNPTQGEMIIENKERLSERLEWPLSRKPSMTIKLFILGSQVSNIQIRVSLLWMAGAGPNILLNVNFFIVSQGVWILC